MDKVAIYFITGLTPSETELEDAKQYGDNVTFRSVKFHEKLEAADVVAGWVPGAYAKVVKADGEPLYEVHATNLAPARVDAAPAPPTQALTDSAGDKVEPAVLVEKKIIPAATPFRNA